MDSQALRDQLLHQNRPEDVRGFLTQVWESHASLPQQTKSEQRKYFLNRGMEILLALPVSSLITTLTVAFSLALVAGFLLLVSNVEEVVSELGTGLSITAYLNDNTNVENLQNLRDSVKQLPGVSDVTYISKTQALEDFKDALGEKGDLLSRFESRSPLPASLEIQLKSQEPSIHKAVVSKLTSDSAVNQVLSGDDFVDRVSGIVSAIKIVGLVGGAFVFIIVVFLILNTIKLVIYSQRHEIEVMQLVGASQSMVRTPFLVAGALQGFFGSLIGVILLRIIFSLLNMALESTKLFGTAIPVPTFFSFSSILLLILLGVALGVIASRVAVGRHLETIFES